MAAEALEKAGKEMGYPLKAETNGSGGAKNVLTKQEIAQCDGIIIAADKNVDMARFDGKPVVKASVSAGINKPQELIQKIVDGKAAVYHSEGGKAEIADGVSHRYCTHIYGCRGFGEGRKRDGLSFKGRDEWFRRCKECAYQAGDCSVRRYYYSG